MLQSVLTREAPVSRFNGGGCPNLRWGIVEAEHQKLDRAVRALIDLGFDTYVATQPVRMRETIRGKQNTQYTTVFRPMFSQYFFVQLDLATEQWARIRKEFGNGVKKLLMTPGMKPALADRGYGVSVASLKADEPNRLKLPEMAASRCKPGVNVLIKTTPTDGESAYHPLAGHLVEVETCDGFTTTGWISLFGGRTRVTLRRVDVSDE